MTISRPRTSTPLPRSHPVGLLPAVLCIGLALGLLLWSAPEASPEDAACPVTPALRIGSHA